jgi:2-C-methyl-D-erythritol 4-phosphate cytidylyltransferase / 2-C-methyl-D-erythritol 2,4-cyclodiphosphate synthase
MWSKLANSSPSVIIVLALGEIIDGVRYNAAGPLAAASMSRYFALVPAAGTGTRFGASLPKQYARIAAQPMLYQALRALCADSRIDQVYVVLAPGDVDFARRAWTGLNGRLQALYCGGASRAQSVYNGLSALRDVAAPDDWVLVHDAARPCLSASALDRLINEVGEEVTGGLLAIPLADTLKRSDDGEHAMATSSRTGLWQAQTPQMFRYRVLTDALKPPLDDTITDESSAVEKLGLQPRLVMGEASNIKVTHADDLALAELILLGRAGERDIRIGQGYDVHALSAHRKLIIGGVEIPYERGLAGHSDADVLLHAVCDALLGAAALGDIGRHFPDSDERYRGVDSRKLLREVAQLLSRDGWRVASVDSTIIAQAPRMAPHIEAMRANIAADLALTADRVNIKAKTTERLGFIGRGEGIAAEAVATIERRRETSG